MPPTQINNLNELTNTLDWQEKRIASLESTIKDMKNAINDLSADTKDNTLFIYKGLPQTGLLSKHFLHRAFAVWGHFIVAQLIIGLFFGLAYLIIFIIILKSVLR